MNIFFTSDTHFGHCNILRLDPRPWDDIEEHDEALINNWNEVVTPDDRVYHIGDVGLCSPNKLKARIDRLNGNIILIKGNHDQAAVHSKNRDRFAEIHPFLEIKVPLSTGKVQHIVLCHYGMRVWNKSHHGSWHLYGHSHGSLPPHGRSFDVGVMNWDYHPVPLEVVRQKMETLSVEYVDHHNPNTNP